MNQTAIELGNQFEKYLFESIGSYYIKQNALNNYDATFDLVNNYQPSLYQCEDWLRSHIDFVCSNVMLGRIPRFDNYNSIGINNTSSTSLSVNGFNCNADGILNYENSFTVLEVKRTSNFDIDIFKSYVIQLLTTSWMIYNMSKYEKKKTTTSVLLNAITNLNTTLIVKIDYTQIDKAINNLIGCLRHLVNTQSPYNYKEYMINFLQNKNEYNKMTAIISCALREIENLKIDVDAMVNKELYKYKDIKLNDLDFILNKKGNLSPLPL